MNIVKIYFDCKYTFKNNHFKNNKLKKFFFFDYLKKKGNIDSFQYNNLLNDTYIILNHNEYILNTLFEYLINFTTEIYYNNKILKFVTKETDSDIKIYNLGEQGFSILNMKTNKTYNFGIETNIPIPYLTGLYSKYNIKLNNKRKYLLGYIGGTWRGERNNFDIPKRKIVIDKLIDINNNNNNKFFYSPIIAKSHNHETELGWSKGNFGKHAKLIYYNCIFSWQPYGDTPTRRGFYEALLCGNIPIISKKSYSIYKNLLIGDKLKDICIILDDNEMYDANFITKYLLNIDNSKIQSFVNEINNIKNRLQWNIFDNENAFHDIINKVIDIP
tara:strand:+ start:556 stop:1545 length:990 start_codon:yes stop_codon:yes gene_type:complete